MDTESSEMAMIFLICGIGAIFGFICAIYYLSNTEKKIIEMIQKMREIERIDDENITSKIDKVV